MRKIYSFLLGGALALSGLATANAQTVKTAPYLSPIAISGGFDDGWTTYETDSADKWQSVSDTSTSSLGGSGYRAESKGNTGTNKNAWLISPAIHLEAGKDYKVIYYIQPESSSHPQDLNVYISTSNVPDEIAAGTPVKQYTNYTTTGWQKQELTFSPSVTDNYHFSFQLLSLSDNWYMRLAVLQVAEDVFSPGPVTNLKADRDASREVKCTLSWTLPTKDFFGNAIEDGKTVEQVNIYRDGAPTPIATLNEAATSFVDTPSTGLEAGIHTYEVEVVIDGALSPKASVTSKYVGPVTPATVPSTWNITSTDDFEDWTSIVGESAQNKSDWSYYSYGPYARFSNSTGQKEENYIVAPPFAITEAGYYLVTVNAMIGNTSYNNSNTLQVRYGDAPTAEALTKLACEKINFTSNSKAPYSYVVNITTPGTYYFACVAASESPSSTTFGVYSIGLEKTEKTPAAVTDLTATPDPDFNLEVVLNWTCPTLSSNGEALAADEYKTEIYKADQLLTTLDGGVATYTDSNIEQPGAFTYSVKTVAAGGASVGAVTIKTKWVGKPIVGLPYKPTLKSDDDTVATWDILDNNNDGSTWKHEPTESTSFRCVPPAESAEGTYEYDDYLLTPYFEAAPGYYELQFRPFGPNGLATIKYGIVKAGSFIPERAELDLEVTTTGVSSAGAMTTHLFKIDEAGEYQVVFAVTGAQGKVSTGAYYQIGINAFSFAEYPVLPGLATDLAVEAAADEVLEATLTWTNPTTTNVEGVDLDAIAKAVIIRDGQVAAEVEEGLVPGQTASFLDSKATGLTSGPHTYSVEIYNASGKSASAAPSVVLDWVGGGLEAPQVWEGGEGQGSFEEWTLVDNGNGSTYGDNRWYLAGSTALRHQSNAGNEDDWAISPRLNIKHGKTYTIDMEAYLGAIFKDYKGYSFDVYVLDGQNTASGVKVQTITLNNESALASSPEHFSFTIVGDNATEFGETAVAAIDEEEADAAVSVPAGNVTLAFHATQKGGGFVRKLAISTEPEESIEIPEDAYVVYSDGALNSELHPYDWWNSSFSFSAENPDTTGNGHETVMSFQAANQTFDWGQGGYAAASMGLNMEKPQNTGIFHDATLTFQYYQTAAATLYIKLTSVAGIEYKWTPDASELNQWNTVTLGIAENFPAVAEEWNANANLGEGYIFSFGYENSNNEVPTVVYLDNIFYTNVDYDWTAPEVTYPFDSVPEPEQEEADVLSLLSGKYTAATSFGIGGWGQTTSVTDITVDEQPIEWLRAFNYLGWELASAIDVTDYDYLHVDYFAVTEGAGFGVTPVTRGGNPNEKAISQTVVLNQWNSYDIALTEYAGLNLADVFQMKFDFGNGAEAYLANVYFWKDPNKEDDEPGQNTGSVEGTYTQGDNTFDYTLNYAAYLNENGTVTVQGAYVWADGNAPVGYLDSLLYITVQGDGEIQTSANSEVTTTASTYTEGQIVTIKFNAPVANGNVIEEVSVKLALFDGIDGIDADGNNDVKYFNLQGVRVDNPTTGVYIVVRGNEVSKQVIR